MTTVLEPFRYYLLRVLSRKEVYGFIAMSSLLLLPERSKACLGREHMLVSICTALLSELGCSCQHPEELRAADANMTLMIQADMLAYRKPGEPLQLGIPDAFVMCTIFRCQADLERQQDRLSSSCSTYCEYLCHIQSRITCWLNSC
jgi:hypothetical protein